MKPITTKDLLQFTGVDLTKMSQANLKQSMLAIIDNLLTRLISTKSINLSITNKNFELTQEIIELKRVNVNLEKQNTDINNSLQQMYKAINTTELGLSKRLDELTKKANTLGVQAL